MDVDDVPVTGISASERVSLTVSATVNDDSAEDTLVRYMVPCVGERVKEKEISWLTRRTAIGVERIGIGKRRVRTAGLYIPIN